MAKAKKTEKAAETKAESVPAAEAPAKAPKGAKAKAAPKAAAAKSAAPATSTPMVDTGLAAQAAAKMLAARANGVTATANTNQKTTSTFKQMKDSLAKPHSSSVGNLLNSTSPEFKKTNQHGHKDKHQGHNQTFGSDASKAFVPRRTGGG